MWYKILSVVAQISILILAIVLIVSIATRQASLAPVEALEKRVNVKLDSQQSYLNEKIKTVQDNLDRYQQIREARAQLFGERLDEMYKLYVKDPTPLMVSAPKFAQDDKLPSTDIEQCKKIIDSNVVYLENKTNKVSQTADELRTETTSRLGVLEARVKALENENRVLKTESKVINNNNSNAVINMPAGLQTLRE